MSMEKKFVSRAAQKLEHGLNTFKFDITGLVCADFGSSTGGFVEVLLSRGAQKVYSVDTSYGELAWTLRNDPRVVVLERTNALHVTLPELMDFISIDTSFTKQSLILPSALTNLKSGGYIISLLKPHYEADKSELIKGVVPEATLAAIVERVVAAIKTNSVVEFITITESPIVGLRGGNREFLLFLRKV